MRLCKRNQFFILMFTIVFVLSGCSFGSAHEPEASQLEMKKLTMQEVIERSNKEMESVKGISIQSKGKQKMFKEGESLDLNIDLTTTMTYEPTVMHIKGKGLTPEGNSLELYLDDSIIYIKDPNKGWIKMGSDHLGDLFNSDPITGDPKGMIDDANKLNDSYKMSQKDGFYVLEMDASADGIEKIKEMMAKNELSTMAQMTQGLDVKDEKDISDIMKEMKIHRFKQVLWIDEKTFELKKMEQKTQFEVPLEGKEVKMEQDMTMTLKGYVDKVTIPDEVKKNAVETNQ